MNDLNKLINEVNQSVMNRNKATGRTQSATPRYAKAKTQLQQKDPVVAWLESQPEVEKVYLDDMGLITGADYNDNITIHEVEVIEYKSNKNLDEFMKS